MRLRGPPGKTAWGTCTSSPSKAVRRLADAGVLARGWDATLASDWLAAQLNPLGWVLLVEDSGWAQDLYEERVATIAQAVLVDTLRP